MKKRLFLFVVAALVLTLNVGVAAAQSEPFTLRLVRDWGYGNGADINGRMTLSVKGDEAKIKQVTFRIDDSVMATVSAAPFKVQFDTNNFKPGIHRLTGEVTTTTGETVFTAALVSNFLDKSETNQSLLKTLLIIGGVLLFSVGGQLLVQKKARNAIKYDENGHIQYGPLGGAICSNCKQPFPRSLLGINLVGVRMERCPHCGKLVQTRRATPAQLEEAERNSRPVTDEQPPVQTELQETKSSYEDSKFTDL